MIDPRPRRISDRPVMVRVEAPAHVDDVVVQFGDGSRRYMQVKLALEARGDAWSKLWLAIQKQLSEASVEGDRLEIVLGEATKLFTNLRGCVDRATSSNVEEWLCRLNSYQRRLVASIAAKVGGEAIVWQILQRCDVSAIPVDIITRDFAPLWMPPSSISTERLFEILASVASEGAGVRTAYDASSLYDRLRADWDVIIEDPPFWGSERYRAAIANMAAIEVPGTDTSLGADAFLWPNSRRYDRNRQPDFDDEAPRWREWQASSEVDLHNFPSKELSDVVIVAGPGFGKTTLVNAMARKVALEGLLPAVIPVPELSSSELGITDYLSRQVNSDYDVSIDWRGAAEAGSAVLLLDGLDEVSSDRRLVILERLKVYRLAHPRVRWLMTVRDAAALAPPSGALLIELSPLDDGDIPKYVAAYRPNSSGLSERIQGYTRRRPDLARLLRIPLFLALLLATQREDDNLPANRTELLETYLEILFRPGRFKRVERDELDPSVLRRIAERAAFEALERDEIGVTGSLLDRCSQETDWRLRTDSVREALVKRGVLRRSSATRFSFPFPIVQEYLAALHLLETRPDDLSPRLELISRRPWAQAVQFALEQHPRPAPLIRNILDREDDAFNTGLRLLGRCIANGMRPPKRERDEIGERLARLWGRASWRAAESIAGIIVDAFSQPLADSVRERLGDRRLIHHGADSILARLNDRALSMSVLAQLLEGDIEHMLNLGEFQKEVDQLGDEALRLYVNRCRRLNLPRQDEEAISALVGHMAPGSVSKQAAMAVALDKQLPVIVRLSAFGLARAKLNPDAIALVRKALAIEGYHHVSSATKALSQAEVEPALIAKLLRDRKLPEENKLQAFEQLVRAWGPEDSLGRLSAILADGTLPNAMRLRAHLFALSWGRRDALDELLSGFETHSAEMVSATVALFGHVLERDPVEKAADLISRRKWSANDRLSIVSGFATGLTYKMELFGFRSGSLIPIPPHPGRTAPFPLFEDWKAKKDYSARQRLRLLLEMIRLGVPEAECGFEAVFRSAMAEPITDPEDSQYDLARALDVLEERGYGLPIEELEGIALNEKYNFSSSAIRMIAIKGTREAIDSLVGLYPQVADGWLRTSIIDSLEPLASRFGVRITRTDKKLVSATI
ncbi:MAG TPA: hypothetical protein VGW40_04775 [Allosphingosinicella sp.]|nr:hypothetical protein [Allosphingosinicella sp.]